MIRTSSDYRLLILCYPNNSRVRLAQLHTAVLLGYFLFNSPCWQIASLGYAEIGEFGANVVVKF